ncbi:hypothetical protein WAI453_012423 [Rhynchosporium graminicola]
MNTSTCRPIVRSFSKTTLSNQTCRLIAARKPARAALAPSKVQKDSPDDHGRISTSRNTASAKRSGSRTQPSSSPSKSYEQILPPTDLLNTAYDSGALHITPEKAMEFFREFLTADMVNSPGWQRRVCLNNDIDPCTLGLLAGILENCEDAAQRRFGGNLLAIAAKFGDRAANLKRVHQANKTGQLRLVPDALAQVGLMAKKGDDPQAMTLLGMVCFSQGKEVQALEWLRKATAGSLDFHGAADALVLQGRILAAKDKEAARAAFQRAATELNDPEAYFRLGALTKPNSEAQHEHLLQAASSGILEACHNLGMIHVSKFGTETNMTSLDDYELARDWTLIAAEGGFGLSMLNMAQMCRSVGERKEGMRWLQKAAKRPEVREEAESLIEQWSS